MEQIFANPHIFFPSSKMDVENNKNAIMKFSLYLIILMLFLTKNWKCVVILIIFMIFTHLITNQAVNYKKNVLNNNFSKCRKSTVDNPMGNVLLYSDLEDLNKKNCNDINNDNNLKYNFYFDSGDLFQKKNNTRPFITMPSQTHPNDIDKFKDYLYNFKPATCKIDSVNCMFNNDIRYHKTPFLSK